MEDEDLVAIPREQWDTILLRAQVELLQRVSRLVELLERDLTSNSDSGIIEK